MIEKLKYLTKSDGLLHTKDVVASGIRKEYLSKLVSSGVLIREARGLYSFTNTFLDEFVFLQNRCKKGVFSYGTAAYLHNLSDRFSQRFSLTVPQSYNVYYLQQELYNVQFHKVKQDWWNLGIVKIESPQGGGEIMIYNKERCVCDFIRRKNQIDPQVFSQTLRGYFALPSRNSIRLLEYASIYNIQDKVQNYMEVLT